MIRCESQVSPIVKFFKIIFGARACEAAVAIVKQAKNWIKQAVHEIVTLV